MKIQLILSFLVMTLSCLSITAQEILLLKTSGKVVIGDTTQISTPGFYNLYVQNGILTEKVKVAVKNTLEWSDDAWDKTPTIDEVEKSITEKKHLPSMPSAETLVQQGYELQSMDAKLLEQIEWLWQHMIALEKENKELKKKIEQVESTIIENQE